MIGINKQLLLLLLAMMLPSVSPAASIDYTYDAAGRLTKETYSDGTVVGYAYDASGNRTGHTVTAAATTTTPATSSTATSSTITTTTTVAASTTTTLITASTTVLSSTSTAPPTTTTTVPAGPCPAKQILGENNPKLHNMRAFRDGSLTQNVVGRKVIQLYYNNAESINTALERSPALRGVARMILEANAPLRGR